VLDLLSQHKADILRLLRPANDGWSPEDWRVFFDERAASVEFDGGLPRAEAEACAFACCVTEWINRNPTPSALGRCLACAPAVRGCETAVSEFSLANDAPEGQSPTVQRAGAILAEVLCSWRGTELALAPAEPDAGAQGGGMRISRPGW